MKQLLKTVPKFEEKVYKNSVFTWVKMFPNKAGVLINIEENTLNELISTATFKVYEQDDIVFPNGGYILDGDIVKKQGGSGGGF